MTWVAVLTCSVGCYLLKLAGLSVPARVLARPVVRRSADLLPAAMLAALVAVQVLSATRAAGPVLVVDARLAGLAAALVALLARAPFLVVVLAAAATAAVLRLLVPGS